jgi:rubrerythrin
MAAHKQEWSTEMTEQMRSAGDVYKSFIPSESGEPLGEQIFPWGTDGIRKDMQAPLRIHSGDPMTVSNVISMMAVEMQHWSEYLHLAQWTTNAEFKRLLISLATAEQVHHLKLTSLLPAAHDPSEMVLASEMALLNTYCAAMASEPNESIRDAFKLLFNDHLEHADYAAKRVKGLGCPVDTMTGGADLSDGNPIQKQFMRPDDTIWKGCSDGSYDKNSVDPRTLINVDMSAAAETAAWMTYQSAMLEEEDQEIRNDFAAFQAVEHQHSAILDSIMDPSETQLERALVHERTEIVNYERLMKEESNEQVRKVFAELYREDMEHARVLGELIL